MIDLPYIGRIFFKHTWAMSLIIPIFILIISSVFFNESINSRQIIGVIVSLLGVLIILTKLDSAVIRQLSFNKGDLWILVGSLDWAVYSIFLKRYRPADLSALSFLGSTMILGLLILLPIYLLNPFNEAGLLINQSSILTLLYIAIFPSIFAYLAWNYGVSKVGASISGQYIHLMPLFGALLAVIFLGEQIRLYHLLGGLSIGIGLWLSRQRKVSH